MASGSAGMGRWLVKAWMWRSNVLSVSLYTGSEAQTQVIELVWCEHPGMKSVLCRTMLPRTSSPKATVPFLYLQWAVPAPLEDLNMGFV